MAYLTFDEWESYSFVELTEEQFDKLEPFAELALDSETRNFYQFNDLESDLPIRRDQFKKAMVLMILYMNQTGFMTASQAAASNVSSISIGRTSISKGGSSGGSTADSFPPGEVLDLLSFAGLRYRGVCYDR